MNYEEKEYLKLLKQVYETGIEKSDRTGVGSKSIWAAQLRFDLSKGFPLLTSRKLSARLGIEEMLFFLRGQTNTKILEEKNINIWKGNTSREFLDKRGLSSLPEGDMGKGYGWQIRNFGGTEPGNGFDQLNYLIENIKANPEDRRHYINYWHPQVLAEAALPPCHLSFNCQVINGKLNSMFYMRSSDLFHGLPHNLVGYALLTHIVAKLTGLEVGEMVYVGADCHIYKSQYEVVAEQIDREPLPFPKFSFSKDFNTLDEALALEYKDMLIEGYQDCGKLKTIPMAI